MKPAILFLLAGLIFLSGFMFGIGHASSVRHVELQPPLNWEHAAPFYIGVELSECDTPKPGLGWTVMQDVHVDVSKHIVGWSK